MFRVVGPFAFGYFLSYCLRNVNAVIAPDLTEALGLTASTLGLLTSAYFFSFAAFQLPLGVLLDRYGPRRVEAVLLTIAGLGALLFAAGDSSPELIFARALIGLGVSGCLMGAFKATTLWFEPARQPLVNGIILSAGGLGALVATQPVEAMLGFTDWRGVFRILAAAALCSAAVLYFVVPRREEEGAQRSESFGAAILGIGEIVRARVFWRVAPMPVCSQAAFLAIQSLWAGPWLKDVVGLDRGAVADHLLTISVAMTLGFLSFGFIAERLERFGIAPIKVATSGVLATIGVTLVLVLAPELAPRPLWALFGFLGTSGILYYPILTREFPQRLSGRVLTTLNVLTFSGAFFFQWGIGAIIERWPGEQPGEYMASGYLNAVTTVIGIQLAAAIWLLWPRARALTN